MSDEQFLSSLIVIYPNINPFYLNRIVQNTPRNERWSYLMNKVYVEYVAIAKALIPHKSNGEDKSAVQRDTIPVNMSK